MTRATPEQQHLLLELQATDTAIRQLEHGRANLAEQQALDENRDTLARINSDFANASEGLSRAEQQQRRLEQEIATVDSRRKSEEGRMYSGQISSDKELQALRAEISSLKGRKGDLEDQLLEVMEEREELEGATTSLKERHAELTALAGQLEEARDEAAADIDRELGELRSRRAEQVGKLPDQLIAEYERLRERKQGVAVAELRGRTCAGCRLELTAIEYEQAKDDARQGLAYCEHCERVLVPVD